MSINMGHRLDEFTDPEIKASMREAFLRKDVTRGHLRELVQCTGLIILDRAGEQSYLLS
jgi:hypothetical protein